jgi:hypothetical protein
VCGRTTLYSAIPTHAAALKEQLRELASVGQRRYGEPGLTPALEPAGLLLLSELDERLGYRCTCSSNESCRRSTRRQPPALSSTANFVTSANSPHGDVEGAELEVLTAWGGRPILAGSRRSPDRIGFVSQE